MKKRDHVWKVVMADSGEFLSAAVGNRYILTYSIGKRTVPEIGKIFVFGTRKYARLFVKHQYIRKGMLKVLKCKFEGEALIPVHMSYPFSSDYMEKFWKYETGVSRDPLPQGTLWVDSVMPIEISR